MTFIESFFYFLRSSQSNDYVQDILLILISIDIRLDIADFYDINIPTMGVWDGGMGQH